MRLNNKGFAITAVLYGILILFVFTVSSYLIALSLKKDRLTSLADDTSSTYYEKEMLPKYSVTYNANGGSGAPSAQTKVEDTDLKLSLLEPTRSSYIFKGWGTSSGDTTVDYSPGDMYTGNADITLYAIWQANSFGEAYGYDEYKSLYTMYVWHYGSKCKSRNQSAYNCDGTRCSGCSENYCETVGTIGIGAKFYYVGIDWDLTSSTYLSMIVYVKENQFSWKGPGLTGTSSIFGSCETDYITYAGSKYHRGIIPARCNASGCSTYQCHTNVTVPGYCKVCPNGVAIPESWSC